LSVECQKEVGDEELESISEEDREETGHEGEHFV
jgi:hypothetical protein